MARGSGQQRRGGRRRPRAPAPADRRPAPSDHRPASFNADIIRILREVQPRSQISAQAVDAMSSLVNVLLDRIATEAGQRVQSSRRRTLTQRDIQAATRQLLPDTLSSHAMAAANQVVAAYNLRSRRH
ncbi:histone H2B.2, sperm-like [Dendropsophus ebraccatus]|uniref:histone H2B.2, sperm-like n=1 Tax=Dendropsophus ebraccatus TaxID=150705 RepID=UPI003831EBD4